MRHENSEAQSYALLDRQRGMSRFEYAHASFEVVEIILDTTPPSIFLQKF